MTLAQINEELDNGNLTPVPAKHRPVGEPGRRPGGPRQGGGDASISDMSQSGSRSFGRDGSGTSRSQPRASTSARSAPDASAVVPIDPTPQLVRIIDSLVSTVAGSSTDGAQSGTDGHDTFIQAYLSEPPYGKGAEANRDTLIASIDSSLRELLDLSLQHMKKERIAAEEALKNASSSKKAKAEETAPVSGPASSAPEGTAGAEGSAALPLSYLRGVREGMMNQLNATDMDIRIKTNEARLMNTQLDLGFEKVANREQLHSADNIMRAQPSLARIAR